LFRGGVLKVKYRLLISCVQILRDLTEAYIRYVKRKRVKVEYK